MFISVGSHRVNHDQLMLQNPGVGLVIHEAQFGPTSPNIIAISRTITVQPMPVFINHRLTEYLKRRFCFHLFVKKCLGYHFRNLTIPLLIQVSSIDSERLGSLLKKSKTWVKQVDKFYTFLLCNLRGHFCVNCQVPILKFSTGEIPVFQVLKGNGTE